MCLRMTLMDFDKLVVYSAHINNILFICGLFNYSVSSSGYIASNDRM
jgi:hypothetical protein